jgi:hypothetical protein
MSWLIDRLWTYQIAWIIKKLTIFVYLWIELTYEEEDCKLVTKIFSFTKIETEGLILLFRNYIFLLS